MIELHVGPGGPAAAEALTQIKLVATRFPGAHELRVVVEPPGGKRHTLTLGPLWLYDGSSACLAALGEFGDAQIVHDLR